MSDEADWNSLLDPDERIIWQGAPSPKVRLEFDSVFGFFFMIAWSAIPIAAVVIYPKVLFLVIPALFVASSFHYFIGQHFWAAFQRRRTFYSLSNLRAFIAYRGLRGRKIDSYPITPETSLQLDEGRNKAVWFSIKIGQQMFSNNKERPVGFERLDAPRDVYQLLRKVQRGDA